MNVLRIGLILLLMSSCSISFAQRVSSNEVNKYVKILKEYGYSKIIGDSEVSKNGSDLAMEVRKLANILYTAGQANKISLVGEISDDKFLAALQCLTIGYQSLYYDRYDVKPFEHFNKAYNLAAEMGNLELQKITLLAILDVYNFEVSQSNENCLEYLAEFKVLVDSPTDEFHYRINLLLYNLRNIDFQVDLNEIFAKEFSELMTHFETDHPFWPIYYSTVGVLYETFDNYGLATSFHKKAILKTKNEPYLKRIKFRSYIHLSEIERVLGNSQAALRYIDSAKNYIDLSDTIRSKYYINYYSSTNYSAIGDGHSAYLSLKRANNLKIKLDYQENSLELSRLNAKYQTAKKEKQILVEQQKARTNRNWLIAAGLALLLGTGIAILLQKNTAKKRQLAEQSALLEQQKVQTLLKEQELVSIDAMIEGQEKERQKVANELHDDLGSLMATVKLHFDNVKVDQKDPALKSAQDLLEKAYQKIRGMAHAKNSGVMADQGLLPAVKKMASTISETNALDISVEDFGLGERMENSLELTLFRIIQELVANIIKHSEATKASIQFTQHKDSLNIIVEDNGKGFDMSAIKRETSGMGLGTVEKRIEHLEGSFTVDSVWGKGTSILIDIPV